MEIGYGIVFFIPFWLIVRILRRTSFQYNIFIILAFFGGYSALLASLMTKTTPSWATSRPAPLFILIFFSIALINLCSALFITAFIIRRRILAPLYKVIRQKEQAEETLRRQRRELSQFAHLLSHELRNNIFYIAGIADLMIDQPKNEYPYTILSRLKQIQDLLESSVKLADAGKIIENKTPVNLNQLVERIIEAVVPKDIKITIGDLPTVQADEYRIIQVFKNLLENAAKHGTPGEIQVYSNVEDSFYLLSISNNGKAISKKVINNFARPDFSLNFHKSGIGLQIVKRIIEAHNWEITIQSEPLTTFVISIPADHILRDG